MWSPEPTFKNEMFINNSLTKKIMKKIIFSSFLSVLFIVSYAQEGQKTDSLNGGFSIKKSIYLEQMNKLNQNIVGLKLSQGSLHQQVRIRR